MEYKYGDLCIKKEKLEDFLAKLQKGPYSTFEILKEYQGEVNRNKNICVGNSWNAYFGKILFQCAERTNGIIKNIAKDQPTEIGGGSTTSAEWEIL